MFYVLEQDFNFAVTDLCFWFQCVKNSEINCSKLLVLESLSFEILPNRLPYFIQVQHPIIGIKGAM